MDAVTGDFEQAPSNAVRPLRGEGPAVIEVLIGDAGPYKLEQDTARLLGNAAWERLAGSNIVSHCQRLIVLRRHVGRVPAIRRDMTTLLVAGTRLR